ncbi:MAG: flagellar hook-associated protein 1 [Alphaproteobacteria bacterium]|nr:flagellar hook-associated protein 1 [Alphaproteobacteria bacterium]
MSLSGTLNTSLAGLQVTQQALQIVGANVANAQTPGYVRKTLTQTETAAGSSISVRMTSINRELDNLIQTQLRQATSGGSYADKLSELYQQLQTIYGAPGSATGVDTLFNNFTTAMHSLAASPNSFAAQSTAVNSAQLLTRQLNAMSNGIQTMRGAAEQGIAADVQSANSALQQIATINGQVATSNAADPTAAALLDQRDKLIDQLSTLMDIHVVKGQFNQVSVYTGSGTQLVADQAATLSFNAQGTLAPSALWNANPTMSGVGTITLTAPGGGSIDLISGGAIQSGEIATYLQMRDKVLPQAQNQLDEFAAQMSQALSDQTIAGTPVVAVPQSGFSVDTTGLQTGNIIHLTYTEALAVQHQISIVRVDDPSVLPLPNSTTPDPNDQVIGINFATGMASVVTQLTTALGASGLQFSNTGNTLQVLNDVANTIAVNSLSETKTITSLTSGSSQLPLFVDGTGIYSGAITASGSQQLGYAQRIAVNGALVSNAAGLAIYSAAPPTAVGDNTRPTFIYDQLTSATLTFSAATGIGAANAPMSGTLTSYLGQLMTVQAQAAADAGNLQQGQDVVVNALQQRMNSTSGVNVDQEMTNLLTLQNAYSANARVFSTVQKMFDTLFQM